MSLKIPSYWEYLDWDRRDRFLILYFDGDELVRNITGLMLLSSKHHRPSGNTGRFETFICSWE